MFRSFFTPPRPETTNQRYRDEGNKMLKAAGSALWNYATGAKPEAPKSTYTSLSEAAPGEASAKTTASYSPSYSTSTYKPSFVSASPKEVIKEVRVEVPVEKIVEREVIKEIPVEKIVEREVIKEVPVEKIVDRQIRVEVPVEKIVYRDREVIKEVRVEVPVEKIVYKNRSPQEGMMPRSRSPMEDIAPALMTGSPGVGTSPNLSNSMKDMTARINEMRNSLSGATRLSTTPIVSSKEEDLDLTLSAKEAQLKAAALTNSRAGDLSPANPLAHTMPSPMLNALCDEVESRPKPTEEQMKQIKAMAKHAAKVAGVNFYDNFGENPNSATPVPRTPGTPRVGAFRTRVSRPDLTPEQLLSPALGRAVAASVSPNISDDYKGYPIRRTNTGPVGVSQSSQLPPISSSPVPSPSLRGVSRSGSMTEMLAREANISPSSPDIVRK